MTHESYIPAIVTVVTGVLAVVAIITMLAIAIMVVVSLTVKLYRKFFLTYDASYITDGQITVKIFNGRPAQKGDKTPMFDEVAIVVSCKDADYLFQDPYYYEIYELGEVVKLILYQGYNKRGDVKHTYFGIEKK